MPIEKCLMLMIVNCAQNLSSGQPRRHLLQSGWSVFVSSKRLVAGDAFIFLRFAVFPAYPAWKQFPIWC